MNNLKSLKMQIYIKKTKKPTFYTEFSLSESSEEIYLSSVTYSGIFFSLTTSMFTFF